MHLAISAQGASRVHEFVPGGSRRAALKPGARLLLMASVSARSRRLVRRLIACAAVVAVCLAVVVVRFVPGRVDRATLNSSVASAVSDAVTRGIGYDATCVPAQAAWRCVLTTTDQSDSGVTYRVMISGNCWTATLSNAAGMLGLPRRANDCIHLLDELTD